MQTRIGLAILVFCLSAWSQSNPATTTPPRRTPARAIDIRSSSIGMAGTHGKRSTARIRSAAPLSS